MLDQDFWTFAITLHQALPSQKVKRKGESLVHFDHVLDMVGHDLQFVVDFAHVYHYLITIEK